MNNFKHKFVQGRTRYKILLQYYRCLYRGRNMKFMPINRAIIPKSYMKQLHLFHLKRFENCNKNYLHINVLHQNAIT